MKPSKAESAAVAELVAVVVLMRNDGVQFVHGGLVFGFEETKIPAALDKLSKAWKNKRGKFQG